MCVCGGGVCGLEGGGGGEQGAVVFGRRAARRAGLGDGGGGGGLDAGGREDADGVRVAAPQRERKEQERRGAGRERGRSPGCWGRERKRRESGLLPRRMWSRPVCVGGGVESGLLSRRMAAWSRPGAAAEKSRSYGRTWRGSYCRTWLGELGWIGVLMKQIQPLKQRKN